MVIFDDFSEAERAGKAIAKARDRLGVKPEFKFSKCRDKVRDDFFETVCPMGFVVRALVVAKCDLYSDHLRGEPKKFYNFFVQKLLQNDNGALRNAIVKIDGSGSREFRRELGAYLRRQLRSGQIKDLKFKDSCGDSLVQLADMCAGAIQRAKRSDDAQDVRWLRMLQRAGRIGDLWTFR